MIRRADLDRDAPAILELLDAFLPESAAGDCSGDAARRAWLLARYDWLYRRCPHGPALTWLATAQPGGRPVGVTSLFPREMVIDGARRRGAIGGEAWVRHEMRRRGIASAMHRRSRMVMAEERIEVMFGTPRQLNVTPLAAAAAFDLAKTELYKRPLDARALGVHNPLVNRLARALLAPRWPGLTLDRMTPDDPRADAVWRRTAPEMRVATVRDARFYTWRFLEMPSRPQLPYVVLQRGEPVAVCALEDREDALIIVDLVAPRAAWWKGVAAIAAHGRERHRAVAVRLLDSDPHARSLRRMGFLPARERLVWLVNVLLPEGAAHSATLRSPEAWFYTYADFHQPAGE